MQTLDRLQELAAERGSSKNVVIEEMVRNYYGTTGEPTTEDQVIVELRDQVTFLRQELVIRSEEIRRRDHIIAALTARVPELEIASEPRESDLRASDAGPNQEAGLTRASSKNETGRSWWRRLIGG